MAFEYKPLAWQSTTAAAGRRRCTTTSIIVVVTIAVTGLVTLAISLYSPVSRSVSRLADSVCYARSFTEPYNMTEHHEFQDLSTEGDAAWRSVFLENGNYLFRQMPSAEAGEPDEVRVYGVSMFHQLHCLWMIRVTLQALNATAHGVSSPVHHDIEDRHYLHCLDYLRQAILCNADDNIEAPQRDPHDATHDIVNGQGQRQCRNPQRLYDWARMSGPSLSLRKQLAAEGATWPALEGVDWPEPIN